MLIGHGLESLKKIVFYAAPSEYSPTPYTIPEGVQLVEVLTAGVVFFDVDGVQRTCRRGTIFWHLPGDKTICQTTRKEPYRCMVFHFRSSAVSRTLPRVSTWRSSDQSLDEFLNTAHRVFFNLDKFPEQRPILENYCASELIMHALQLKDRSPYAPQCIDGDDTEKLLASIIATVERTPELLPNTQAMCDILKIPRNKLFALFKEKLQTTPHQWLREKQLQHARSLLESTPLAIKEIAGMCGFEHVEVFHRCFSKHFGETPKNYRINHFAYQDFGK